MKDEVMYSTREIQELVKSSFESELLLIGNKKPAGLYQPICYALQNGGKRIRPTLVLLACNLFTDNIRKAFPIALATEIFHNFTLLHDDIMDKATVRRNKPTVHVKYNENTAILSGDAMNILAYEYLSRSDNETLPQLLELFNKTALEVCEGQQLDMDFESEPLVSIDDYINMIRLKTAVLLACSLKSGALAACAPEEDTELLYQFGINIGLAFQLQDDLLDTFGDKKVFGKNIGGDILCNKKTYLLLQALNVSEGRKKKELLDWISRKEYIPQEKIESVTSIYNDLNIKHITEEKIDAYHRQAINDLNRVRVPEFRKEQLFNLTSEMMRRNH
ncbi:MAG: polyprenyl synthetase family protein [Bacteroidota bacterium]|nr:polyprenyl synthetase family protein [Bacteroidota bacterium]MDP4205493.1 polyprenyl synthetase family protein [Bacteroidota bacterium]